MTGQGKSRQLWQKSDLRQAAKKLSLGCMFLFVYSCRAKEEMVHFDAFCLIHENNFLEALLNS